MYILWNYTYFTAVMVHYPKHVKILGFHFDIFQDTNFRNT